MFVCLLCGKGTKECRYDQRTPFRSRFSPPIHGSWELNLGPQAWQQAPFPVNLSILPTTLLYFLDLCELYSSHACLKCGGPAERWIESWWEGRRELLLGRLRQAGEQESPTKGYSPRGSYSSMETSSSCLRLQVSHRIVEQCSLKIQMLLRLECPEGIGVNV